MKKPKAVLESEAAVMANPDTDLDLDDVVATSPKAKAELEALRAENARLRKQGQDDTARLLYSYSVHQTTSDALIKAELRLLSGQSLSIEEIKAAIDDAMNNDPRWKTWFYKICRDVS